VAFLSINYSLSVELARRFFSQVLGDFSFKTATFSMPADAGRNDLDEQKTDEDGENNKQIEIVFRHCPCVSVKRLSNAETATEPAKNGREWRRLPEMSLRPQQQDAPLF